MLQALLHRAYSFPYITHRNRLHIDRVPDPKTTPVGFEPTRGDPIGLAGRRLNRSAKVSLMILKTK